MNPAPGGLSSSTSGTHHITKRGTAPRRAGAFAHTEHEMSNDTAALGLEKPRKRVAVIMQRRAIDSRWQSEVWEPLGVLAGYEGEADPRMIVEEPDATQWLYPGFEIVLQRSEAEGYFHNVSTAAPNVF